MKKTIALSLLTLTLLSAESKTELLSNDATMQQSKRKAVMGIAELGLEETKFTFPVFYTPYKGKSRHIGDWSVVVREDYVDGILAENYPFLIPARFDKLIFNKNKADVLTATKKVSLDTTTTPFSYATGSLENFQNLTLEYLNKEIAPKVKKVLAEASDARYKEMATDEAESFITAKAKESGVPAEVLKTLINSSYVFNVYMEKMQGQLNIAQVELIGANGAKYLGYTTSLSAPLNLDLTVYEYKDGTFSIRETIDSKPSKSPMSALIGSMAKASSGTAGVTTKYLPSESNAQKVFDEVLQTSFKDNMIALSTRLKRDDAFKVSTPLINVSTFSADLAVGNQEDIRVDHPFIIRRDVDGKSKEIAFVKVRTVGKNCLALAEEKRTPSHAAVISGSIEEADMAYEHPWTGVFGNLYAKTLNSTLTYNDKDTGGGAISIVGLGFNADAGYVANDPKLSEVWLTTNFFAGVGSEAKVQGGGLTNTSSSFVLGFNVGVQKRFYLISNIFVAPAIDANYEIQGFDLGTTYYGDPVSLSVGTLSAEPKVRAGYNLSPNIDINAFVGYDVPLMTSASYKVGDGDPVTIDGYGKNSGLSMGFAINIHSDFAGPFAKMFKKPSTTCDALRK